MNEKIIKFRMEWEKRPKIHLLDLKSLPESDINKSPIEIYDNIKIRFEHLAEIVYTLYKLYNENKNLYSEKFPAFVGNSVIREWPNKDLEFTSNEWESSSDKKEKPHKEHWTPISFFRELFLAENMTKKDFYDGILYYYRVVLITKSENDKLNKKHNKITRPFNAYKECGIEIHEEKDWDAIYGNLDKSINNESKKI